MAPPPLPRPYCCERCEDAAFLLDAGTPPETTASRLDTNPLALAATMRRHGHTTYATRLHIPDTTEEHTP
jgi:hypothetical protein